MENIAIGEVKVTVEYGTVALIKGIADEWRGLADQSEVGQPFYHPEFIAGYVRFFTPGKVVLLTARINGALKAVLPLVEEQVSFYGIPAKRWRSPANALRFDLTRANGEEGDAAVHAIWRELKEIKTYDFLELREVPEGGECEKIMRAAEADRFPVGVWMSKDTPHIPLKQIGEKPWLNLARKSLIDTLKTSRNKMVRELGAAPLLVREHALNKETLENFYALEAAGWKGKGGTAIASKPHNLGFHNEYTAAAAQQGYLCLDSLYCKDRLVSAAISFVHRKKYFVLKWSYDEELQKYAPGHLLINAILERCVQEGYEEFDFMGEKYGYEVRWTPMTRDHHFLYIFQPTIKGRLMRRLKFGLVPILKNVKSRLSKSKS